jgi:hypothetical protein
LEDFAIIYGAMGKNYLPEGVDMEGLKRYVENEYNITFHSAPPRRR